MHLSILHVIAPGEVGGLERVVQMLATGHAQRGHRVSVAAVLDAPRREHVLLDALRSEGVEIFACPVAPRRYRRERQMIAGLIERLRPDVVHTHGYRTDVVDAGVALGMGVPTVTTVHGFTGGGLKNRLYERLQRRAFQRFSGVVAVSRPLHRALISAGLPPQRVHLVPNAWAGGTKLLNRSEARHALGIGDDSFHIGWVGRISREKGADVLVDALPMLRDLSVRVSIIGDGRERAAIRRRAAELGVEQMLRLHGPVPDAVRLFSGFDAFVLSSRTEGTPIVLFEAMYAQVPIVATTVGGVPDVVSAEEALLIPAQNPAALAGALRKVRRDARAAVRRVRAAAARLDRDFAVDPWLARYERIYRQVAGEAEVGPASIQTRAQLLPIDPSPAGTG